MESLKKLRKCEHLRSSFWDMMKRAANECVEIVVSSYEPFFPLRNNHLGNHFYWLTKHMQPSAVGKRTRKEARKSGRKKDKNPGQRSEAGRIFWGQWLPSLPGLIRLSSHFPLSSYCCCYYFHRRQEVALSQPNASLPAAYQAVAGCLSWSGFHPNKSVALLNERTREKKTEECVIRWVADVCVSCCWRVRVRADPWRGCDMFLWGHLDLVSPPRSTCCDGPAERHPSPGCWESYDWVLTCLWWVTYLPSWFLSMTSNCFLSHLQREGWRKKTWDWKSNYQRKSKFVRKRTFSAGMALLHLAGLNFGVQLVAYG